MCMHLQIAVRLLGDEEYSAAAGRRRDSVLQQPLLDDQHTRGADAAHELHGMVAGKKMNDCAY